MATELTPEEAQARISAFAKKFDPTINRRALHKAVEIIEDEALKNMRKQPIPKNPSMISRSRSGDPQLKLLYSRFPWAAGAEAGSQRFRQFRRYVGFGDSGYMIGQALQRRADKSAQAALDEAEKAAKETLHG